MWWRAFGKGRCLLVGDAARGLGQGFVVDAFETVLRMHRPALTAKDVGIGHRQATISGNKAVDVHCGSLSACQQAAAARGCASRDASAEFLSLAMEEGIKPGKMRTLLGDVYMAKLGVFGGPAAGAS